MAGRGGGSGFNRCCRRNVRGRGCRRTVAALARWGGVVPEASKRFQDLYDDIYAGGVARAWRDTGAVDKAKNIEAIWHRAHHGTQPRVVEFGCGEGAVAAALAKL